MIYSNIIHLKCLYILVDIVFFYFKTLYLVVITRILEFYLIILNITMIKKRKDILFINFNISVN